MSEDNRKNDEWVVRSLTRIEEALADLRHNTSKDVTELKVDMATLKTKVHMSAAIIGTVCGSVFSIVGSVIVWLITK